MAAPTFTLPDTRLARFIIEGIGGGIIAGISAWGVYFGLRQAYWSVLILLKPTVSIAARLGDSSPLALVWLAILISVLLPVAAGGGGIYAALSRKLWSWIGIEFRAPADATGGEE